MAKSPTKLISIKWKIFGLIAFLISLAVAAISWRAYVIFKEDKGAFVKELSAKLASSTAKTFSDRVSSYQDKLVIFISSKESLSRTGTKVEDQLQVLFSRYPEFLSVGLARSDADGNYQADWFVRNPQEAAQSWVPEYEKTLVGATGTFDYRKASQIGRYLARAKDPQGKPLLLLGFSVDVAGQKSGKDKSAQPAQPVKAWIIGVMSDKAFDDLMTDFESGVTKGFLVDDKGTVIAHTDKSKKGMSFSRHPIVKEVMASSKPASAGEYEDLDGIAIIGGFELVPKLNIGVVAVTPKSVAFEAVNAMAGFILLVAAIILVLGLAAAVFFSNLLTAPLQQLSEAAKKIGDGDFKVPIKVKSKDEIGLLAHSFQTMEDALAQREEALQSAQSALVQSEKMSAFGQLSAGIAHEVKNPLAGILGHAQLAMGKSPTDDMKKHLEVIEKETRRCKTIIESLMKFARAEKTTLVLTDLGEVIQSTIDLVDHQLSLAGCKVFKEIQEGVPKVDANGNQLQQVLLNLMMNASHAMEGRTTKNVTARLVRSGNKAQIQIADTGSGMPPHVQKKIFEPFFTTKPAGKGTGLGLSVSIGIVKEHKGEISLKSEEDVGTTFFIDIPIPESELGVVADAKPASEAAAGPPSPTAQAEPAKNTEPVTGTTAAHEIVPKPGAAAVLPPPAPLVEEESFFKSEALQALPKLPAPLPPPPPDEELDAMEKGEDMFVLREPSMAPPAPADLEPAFDSPGGAATFKVKIRKPKLKA